MTLEDETEDRGRTWCAWPDWPGLQTLTWHHVTEPYRTEGDETEVARRQGVPGLPETEQGSPKEDVGNDNHLGVICLDRFW